MPDLRKAAIIGCGAVGASIAFHILHKSSIRELVLIDSDHEKAVGEAMDLSHGLPYTAPMRIYAGDYKDIADCGMIIITAGANQKPGETRLDLIGRNIRILRQILGNITPLDYRGMIMIVANPVDILTHEAQKITGYGPGRVFGSGTVLDTGRLKQQLGRQLQVDPRSVHAFIIGEHGDSELAVWSSANISGIDMDRFCHLRGIYQPAVTEEVYREVRTSAYEIIRRKGVTCYGIAMAVGRILDAIIRDEQAVLPVSVELRGEYGLRDLSLSVPSIVGREGVKTVLEIPLDKAEWDALHASARQLRKTIEEAEKDTELV